MIEPRVLLRAALLVAAALALLVAASQVRDKRALARMTVDDIEAQLDALDPATRAAVIARLSKDAATTIHAKRKKA